MTAVNSGFESCVLNLFDSSQELNIDGSVLKEVNAAVRQVLLEDKNHKKRGPYKSLPLTPLQHFEIGKHASEVGIPDACKKFHIPHTNGGCCGVSSGLSALPSGTFSNVGPVGAIFV